METVRHEHAWYRLSLSVQLDAQEAVLRDEMVARVGAILARIPSSRVQVYRLENFAVALRGDGMDGYRVAAVVVVDGAVWRREHARRVSLLVERVCRLVAARAAARAVAEAAAARAAVEAQRAVRQSRSVSV